MTNAFGMDDCPILVLTVSRGFLRMRLAQIPVMEVSMNFYCVTALRTLVDDDRGQDLIEYALLSGFISLIVVLTVTNLGQTLDGLYSGVAGGLP